MKLRAWVSEMSCSGIAWCGTFCRCPACLPLLLEQETLTFCPVDDSAQMRALNACLALDLLCGLWMDSLQVWLLMRVTRYL